MNMTPERHAAWLKGRAADRNRCEQCAHPVSRARRSLVRPWICVRCDERNKRVVREWMDGERSLA